MKSTIDDLPLPAEERASVAGLTPKATWIIALCILLAAIVVRIYPSAGFTGMGFDEALYREYVIKLDKAGLGNYPLLCQLYLEDQRRVWRLLRYPR